MTASQAAVKRASDVVGSVVALVILLPVLALIAVAIKWDTAGPVLFRQRRLGRNGVPFTILKFRTMVAGAAMLRNADGSTRADDTDARITRVGRLLRGALDELPQLWNVLRGEMSLVGPRPDLEEQLPLYSDREHRKLAARPGITSLPAVSGRNAIPWKERIAIDIQYIDRYSIALDVKIIVLTLLLPFRAP